jgi:hypothetical protein
VRQLSMLCTETNTAKNVVDVTPAFYRAFSSCVKGAILWPEKGAAVFHQHELVIVILFCCLKYYTKNIRFIHKRARLVMLSHPLFAALQYCQTPARNF